MIEKTELIAEIDRDFVRKYRRHLWIGEFIYRHPSIRNILFRIGVAFESIKDDYERHVSKILYHEKSQSLPEDHEDRFSKSVMLKDVESQILYGREAHDPDFSEDYPTESYALYREQEKMLGKLLQEDDQIKNVLNFGVCYPHVDSILAKTFPQIGFHGIDLSECCKAVNESLFGEIDNLHFYAGNIFDLLNEDGFKGGVLFHSRIMLLFPRSFVEELFKTARDAGFKYLIGFEQFGFSTETLEPYEFSEKDRESVYWRDRMAIHNYPGIVTKLGAEVLDAHILKTANRSPDYRLFCYVAKF